MTNNKNKFKIKMIKSNSNKNKNNFFIQAAALNQDNKILKKIKKIKKIKIRLKKFYWTNLLHHKSLTMALNIWVFKAKNFIQKWKKLMKKKINHLLLLFIIYFNKLYLTFLNLNYKMTFNFY